MGRHLVEPSRGVAIATAMLLLAAFAEGLVAASAVAELSGGAADMLAGFVLAAALVSGAGLVPAVVVGWLADRASARALGRGIAQGLGDSSAIAIAVSAVVIGAAVAAGALIGRSFIGAMTPPFAATAVALSTVLGLLLAGVLAGPLATLLARLGGERVRSPMALPVLLVVAALVLLGVGLATLPREYTAAPTLALLALALALTPPGGRLLTRLSAWPRQVVLLLFIAGSFAAALSALSAFPSSAQSAVLYQAPLTGNLASLAWRATDGDGDGYSPRFLGGDCDDSDPSIFPGAQDVPDNGIDENCSGADAATYRPVTAPEVSRPRVAPTPHNFVLIQVDALRPDHLGFAGYERPTSPRLDRFREQSTWFTNAYTPAPSTRFAMASVFTGFDTRRVPYRDLGANRFRLEAGASTVAEQLAEAGYDTVGYTISYVMHHNHGLGQGFRVWSTPWPVDDWADIYPVAAERTTDAVLEYLAERPDTEGSPYLLFAHYRCTHDPYIKYDEWDFGDEDVDRYDSALRYCDGQIGRVLDALSARSDEERTTVVLFSDHGELFGEHGLTNHGNSLYETDVRVALLARIAGAASGEVQTPVSITDIAPTLLELAGLRAPRGADGWSLLTHLSEDAPEDFGMRPLFMFTDLHRANVHIRENAVLRWPLKLVRDQQTGAERLYDVEADPEEASNLLDSRADDRRDLAELLESYTAYAHPRPADSAPR